MMMTGKILFLIYLCGILLSFPLIYTLSEDTLAYRLLSALLISVTWPLSMVPAILFSLL